MVAVNGDLQHELDMYKSVMVPVDQKPRTNITRVARPPLINLARTLNTGSIAIVGEKVAVSTTTEKAGVQRVHALETIPGDMTLDEFLP